MTLAALRKPQQTSRPIPRSVIPSTGTQRRGGTTINAALLGQVIPFATPGQSDIWGGFGGLGLEWRSRNATLFSAAEYLAQSDNSNVVSGRAGIRVAACLN